MEQQIWPTKQPDGRIYERHVYSGPQGEGCIDIFMDIAGDGTIDVSCNHNGPEARTFPTKIDSPELKVKLERLKEEKAEWTENNGFKIKPEFKDVLDDSGMDKIIEEPI
jgi:L-lactate utilization protein LutB